MSEEYPSGPTYGNCCTSTVHDPSAVMLKLCPACRESPVDCQPDVDETLIVLASSHVAVSELPEDEAGETNEGKESDEGC
jgi:hypothetical protein